MLRPGRPIAAGGVGDGLAADVARGALPRRENRDTRGQGLEYRQAEALVQGREGEHGAGLVQRREIPGRQPGDPMHAARGRQRQRGAKRGLPAPGFADQHEMVRQVCGGCREGLHEQGQVLVGVRVGHAEDERHLHAEQPQTRLPPLVRRNLPPVQGIRAEVRDVDALPRASRLAHNLPARKL